MKTRTFKSRFTPRTKKTFSRKKRYSKKRAPLRSKRWIRKTKKPKMSSMVKLAKQAGGMLGDMRYFQHKMTSLISITNAGNANVSWNKVFGFAWQQPSRIPVGADYQNIAGFDSAARWQQVYSNYFEFAVTGMAIEWFPSNLVGFPGVGMVGIMSKWETPEYNTLNYTLVDSLNVGNYTQFQVNRHHRWYRNFRDISNQMQCPWQKISTYAPATANTLSQCATTIRVTGRNTVDVQLEDAMNIGMFKICWYVTFRGQRDIAPAR